MNYFGWSLTVMSSCIEEVVLNYVSKAKKLEMKIGSFSMKQDYCRWSRGTSPSPSPNDTSILPPNN